MWKYRHSVRKSEGRVYDWSATGQRQTAFCMCQWEHWECRRTCAQSGFRKTIQKRTDRFVRSHCEADIHRLPVHKIIHCDLQLKCVKRRRAQQLSETNRVARLTRCKQLLKKYSDPAVDFIWFTNKKCLPSNHHSTRRTIGFIRQSVPRSDTSIPFVCNNGVPAITHALNIQQDGYGVRCSVNNGYDWTDIFWP